MTTIESASGVRIPARLSAPEQAERLALPTAAPVTTADAGAVPTRADVDTSVWRRRYALILTVSDLVAVLVAVFGTQLALSAITGQGLSPLAWGVLVLLAVGWMCVLAITDTRSFRVVGSGSTEFKRVWDASFALLATATIATFLFGLDIGRSLVLLSLPVGVSLLFIERALWRQWLKAARRNGQYSARVLVVGAGPSVNQVVRDFVRSPQSGYRVVGVCMPTGEVGATMEGTDIPIMGTTAAISGALEATGADTVVVTGADDLPPDKVKEISWALEAGKQHLLLAPSITDIAGPRIHTRPAAGLPLIHVETPRFTNSQRIIKRSFDIVVSSIFIVLLLPVFAVIAAVVKLTSAGPVLYRQERVGHNGEPFHMLKFRSMRMGADAELAQLLADQGTSEQPLFKIKDDPRITPVGRVLRKYSLDELPQLFNAWGGSMSLVGPRPQIAAEVALYSSAARRRLLVRPGLTGLWQVSGRSTLDWEQTVRLDLYYVENWSLLGDVSILLRTVKAVVAPGETAH